MRQPDCYLKEYLDEIHRRYGVQVTVGHLSRILKDLGIIHKMVHLQWLLANSSLQRKRYNKIKIYVMHGFASLLGGTLSKLFFLMNLVSIQALEQELTDGAQKAALFHILSSFRIVPISAFFLP
jgi:hypothetical protein